MGETINLEIPDSIGQLLVTGVGVIQGVHPYESLKDFDDFFWYLIK